MASKQDSVQSNPVLVTLVTLFVLIAFSACGVLIFNTLTNLFPYEPPARPPAPAAPTRPASPAQKMTLVALVATLNAPPAARSRAALPDTVQSPLLRTAAPQPPTPAWEPPATRLTEALPPSGYLLPEIPSASPTPTDASRCPQGCIEHVPGCDIKGNVSKTDGEYIYHLPGGRSYDETIIEPEDGERWFCSAAEAEANGWRAAQQ